MFLIWSTVKQCFIFQESVFCLPDESTKGATYKSVNVTTTDALILKSQLGLPWNKEKCGGIIQHSIFHFRDSGWKLKVRGCSFLLFSNGGEEVRPAPLVYVPDLVSDMPHSKPQLYREYLCIHSL